MRVAAHARADDHNDPGLGVRIPAIWARDLSRKRRSASGEAQRESGGIGGAGSPQRFWLPWTGEL